MPSKLSKHYYDTILEMYDNNEPVLKIAKAINKPHPTVTHILKKSRGYENKRPSQGNIRYFQTIDTHNKAYLLGFIAADGCISKYKGLYSFTLVSNSKDDAVILFMQKEIGFETKILYSTPFDKRTNKHNNRVSVTLGNQLFCKDLMNLGILERKTYTLENFLLNIPKEFRKSAIIGYFDGDGSISKNIDKRWTKTTIRVCKVDFCGTEKALLGIVDELQLKNKPIAKKNHFLLTVSNRKDFYKVFSCYEKLNFYLERKHKLFLEKIEYDNSRKKIMQD